ncbi:MAG: hypothetical protein U0350_47495 [Caldilineaceae bacterium]
MSDITVAPSRPSWRKTTIRLMPYVVGLCTLAACVFPIQPPPANAPANASTTTAVTTTVATTATVTTTATAMVTTTTPTTATKATTTTAAAPAAPAAAATTVITGAALADLKQRYAAALQDAKVAEPSEVYTGLIAITPDNQNLVWDKATGRLLVSTWTSYKGYDPQVGKELTVTRETWVTTVPELKTFCQNYQATPDAPLTLRMEELLGLPPNNGKTRIVSLWVKPESLFRPAPDNEITDTAAEVEMPPASHFKSQQDYEYARDWYNLQLKLDNYDDPTKGYPWTRLGYTYDWGNPKSEVGLSEFVIYANSPAKVESVALTEDYCKK